MNSLVQGLHGFELEPSSVEGLGLNWGLSIVGSLPHVFIR